MSEPRKKIGEAAGEKPPPPKPALEPVKLKTPMPQNDVETEPGYGGFATIRRGISVVWAVLWGWTGSARKLIRCSNDGELYVTNSEDRSVIRYGTSVATAYDDYTAWQDIPDGVTRLVFTGPSNHYVQIDADNDDTEDADLYSNGLSYTPWIDVDAGYRWRAKYDAMSGVSLIRVMGAG